MKAVVNKSHIEGYIYEHTLESKVSGPNSKNPGTEFISGNLSVATDEAILNIVTVHFSLHLQAQSCHFFRYRTH